ncbi:hypothetical protein ACO0SA_000470 [Hanseniaspora valbyensis]
MFPVLMRRSTSSTGSSSRSTSILSTSSTIINNITNFQQTQQQTRSLSLFKNENKQFHEIRLNMTPYEVLGVSNQQFNEKLIKKQYYKLCKEYHPDINQSATVQDKDFDKKFHMIKDAYSILKDPLLKRQYDSYGIGWKYNMAAQSKNGLQEDTEDMMDEVAFRNYMNASTFGERTQYHSGYGRGGNGFNGHNIQFFKNGTLLTGKTLSNWEIFGWCILIIYCARLFFIIGALDYVSTNDENHNVKDADWQHLMKLDLLNAYTNQGIPLQDPWNRIRRFLFFRSYENLNRTKRVDFDHDADTNEVSYNIDSKNNEEKDVSINKSVKKNEEYVQNLKKHLEEKEKSKNIEPINVQVASASGN